MTSCYRFFATPRARELPALFPRVDVAPRFPELRVPVVDARVDEGVALLAGVRPVLPRLDAVFRAAPVRFDVDRDDDDGFAVRDAPRALRDEEPRPLAALRPRVEAPPAPRRRAFALPRETSLMKRLLPCCWIMAARRRDSNVSNH